MLATGIEIEARPAGEKAQRLSLLSAGERRRAAQAGRSRDSHVSNAEHGHCDDTTPPPNIHEGVDE